MMDSMTDPVVALSEHTPMATLTTLTTGGPARWLARVDTPAGLRAVLEFARQRMLPTLAIGSGSNLVVADEGFGGLVLRYMDSTLQYDPRGDGTVRVGAGCTWDTLVAWAVEHDLAGIECLSGIPGCVGAAPIQNIGAYGQEIAESIVAIDAIERASGEPARLAHAECGFGYRTSRFKTDWADRFLIIRVELKLRPGGAPHIRYDELRQRLESGTDALAPTLRRVRETVIAIRRGKSMVLDPEDPNHRSAGSFFLNPVVEPRALDAFLARLDAEQRARLPRWPQADGRTKLPAAWLIEHAGVHRGMVLGHAAVSSRHTLALVNRGGARTHDLLALAAWIRRRVRVRFGLTLSPEPVFVGFRERADVILDEMEATLEPDPGSPR